MKEKPVSCSPAGTTRSKSREKRKAHEMDREAAASTLLSQDPFEESEEQESEAEIDNQAPAKSLDVSEESDFARSQASASKKRWKSESVAVASTPTEKRKKRTVDKKFLQGNLVKRF